jgi:hypothetical protein
MCMLQQLYTGELGQDGKYLPCEGADVFPIFAAYD